MVFVVKNREKYFKGEVFSLIVNQRNDEVLSMLENVPVHELTDCKQRTLLHHAAHCGNAVITQYLIDRGCELNATDVYGNSPLHIAIQSSRAPVATIETLLSNGANVNARDEHGRTPLHLYRYGSRSNKELKILKILMEYGASPHLLDDEGDAAFEYVFRFGNKLSLQTLLQYEIDLFARDRSNRTAVHFLAENEKVNDMIKLMEGQNFDVDARDSKGETPLFIAASYADINAVEFFLKHGAAATTVNNLGKTALYAAVWTGLIEKAGKEEQKVVELLLQHGADAQSLDFGEPEDVVFDFHLPLLQTVIAHLAMIESQGQVLTELARAQIDSKTTFQDHFAKCQQQLEGLKEVTVHESVTLYNLLTENPYRIVNYAFKPGFASTFKGAVRKVLGIVDSYYYHALRRRVGKAIQRAEMKLRAAAPVQELTGFHVISHRIIVNKIADYLNDQDLKNLLHEEQELLLPLNSIFSTEN